MSTLGKHWVVGPQTEVHRRKIGVAGTQTRIQRRDTGVYAEASRKGWEGLTAEERSQRTEPGRNARRHRIVQRGNGSHTSEYGADWLEFREQILRRDGYRCQLASLHRGRPPGRRLEVHHRCGDSRCRKRYHLVTLCSRCHQGGHRRGELGKIEVNLT